MEVEIISRETIKPSTPTPPHLKIFNLSFLDQTLHLIYTRSIFYYPKNHENLEDFNQVSNRLKNSLSKTLSLFYPLAGRIKDHLSIDCNDEGASYMEAQVKFPLSEFLKQPKLELLRLFIQNQPTNHKLVSSIVQVVVQVNEFTCGGIAIGVALLHKIVDGTTMSSFLNTWASIASCSFEKIEHPKFEASSLFPPMDSPGKIPSLTASWLKEGKSLPKRFVFDSTAIAKLKTMATSSCVTNPSRVQVVSGIIWKCCMVASKSTSGIAKQSIANYAVDLRSRNVPPLPRSSLGNIISSVHTNKASLHMELHDLVALTRKAIGQVNGDFLSTLHGNEGVSAFYESIRNVEVFDKETMESYTFTSWCNSGLYDVDFGWGKPIWVSAVMAANLSVFANVCVLVDTKEGNGVEAWLNLDEKQMAILERDPDFLEFASPNPSITNE